MDALTILVPLFTAMLGIFIGYFLKQSLYERKRKDELADRDFSRRTTTYDMRIKEARDYVDSWEDLIAMLGKFNSIIEEENNDEKTKQHIRVILRSHNDLPTLLKDAYKKGTSIYILKDAKLRELDTKLIQDFAPQMSNLLDLMQEFEEGEAKRYSRVEAEAYSEILGKARYNIMQMKIRLDELTQIIK